MNSSTGVAEAVGLDRDGLGVEALRKSIHLLVALVPVIAAMNVALAMELLAAGTLFYVMAEHARRSGVAIGLISDLTLLASRHREKDRFVTGPVTLGIGAMLALLLYPMQASVIAIFALAFGDSFASLVGKAVGGVRVPLTAARTAKTLAGSAACLVTVTFLSVRMGADVGRALWIGVAAAVLEAYAPQDLDNVLVPVGTGLVATILLR